MRSKYLSCPICGVAVHARRSHEHTARHIRTERHEMRETLRGVTIAYSAPGDDRGGFLVHTSTTTRNRDLILADLIAEGSH